MEFEKDIYIPKASREALALLTSTKGKVRKATEDYSDKILQPVILCQFKGNAPRKSFQGFGVYLVDFGSVGRFFAEFAIRKCYAYIGEGKAESGLIRCGTDNGRLFPLSCQEFNTWLDVMKINK